MTLVDPSYQVKKLRFSFRLVVGEEETKMTDAAKNDHITQLFAQSKRLLEKTRQFISLQEMNREAEDNLFEVIWKTIIFYWFFKGKHQNQWKSGFGYNFPNNRDFGFWDISNFKPEEFFIFNKAKANFRKQGKFFKFPPCANPLKKTTSSPNPRIHVPPC